MHSFRTPVSVQMDPHELFAKVKVGDPFVVRHLNPPNIPKPIISLIKNTSFGRRFVTHQFIEIYVTTDIEVYKIFTIGLGALCFWDEPVSKPNDFPVSNNLNTWKTYLQLHEYNPDVKKLLQFLRKSSFGDIGEPIPKRIDTISPATRNMCIGTVYGSTDTVKIQTPDPIYRLECNCSKKTLAKMVGSIPDPQKPCTIEERIHKIKKHKSFILQSSITKDHLKWLKRYVKCLHKQPSTVLPGTDVWCLPKWVTDKYKFKYLSRILQYRTRRSSAIRNSRSRKRVQGNNEDYQCQKFAYEFAHHPKRLLRIFDRRSRRSATANDTFHMKVKKFLTFI